MIIEWMLLAAIASGQAQTPPQPPATAPAPTPASAPSPGPLPAAPPAPAPDQSAADRLPSGPASHAPLQAEPAPAAGGSAYREYGKHDVSALIGTRRGEDGKERHVLSMQVVDDISADLAAHALRYPPTFRSAEERQRAESDVQRVAGVIETVARREPGQVDDVPSVLLLKLAMLQHIANNLDVPDSAEHAIASFERLLAREPDNRWANYHYGVFLAGTVTLQSRAEPYLRKALALGLDEARHSLALLHLSQGDKEAALQDLAGWLELHPDDARAKQMMEAIKSDHLESTVIK